MFADDIVLPGMLHGCTIRSTVARGALTSIRFPIDTAGFTIVVWRDTPAAGRNVVALIKDDRPFLAEREVQHVAEPILLLAHADSTSSSPRRCTSSTGGPSPATIRSRPTRPSALAPGPRRRRARGADGNERRRRRQAGRRDRHVHVNEPGRTDWEGFASATRAAGKCPVDPGFIGGVVPGNAGEPAALRAAGVLAFKCFLAPSGVPEFPPRRRIRPRAGPPGARPTPSPRKRSPWAPPGTGARLPSGRRWSRTPCGRASPTAPSAWWSPTIPRRPRR